MTVRWAIIADDLTGAADCVGAFARRGMESAVLLNANASDGASVAAVAVDADTRTLSVERAARTTAEAVSLFARDRTLFKKIDSMLRGHVGAESAAALASYRVVEPGAVLVMAPAFPEMDRTTSNGRQWVNGTEAGDVREMLEGAGLRTLVVGAGMWTSEDCDAIVCDAGSETHLRAIVEHGSTMRRSVLWGGTAGLARCLADRIVGKALPARPVARGPVLFVVGSSSPVSREQIEALGEDVRRVRFRGIFDGTSTLDGRCDAVAFIDAPHSLEPDSRLCRDLVTHIRPCVARYGALVLAGGETARTLLTEMNVNLLHVAGEVEAGVPISTIEGGIPVVTKAGAFGSPQTLERCRKALRGS